MMQLSSKEKIYTCDGLLRRATLACCAYATSMTSFSLSVCHSACLHAAWWNLTIQCNKKWKSAYDRIGRCLGYMQAETKPYRTVLWSRILLRKTSVDRKWSFVLREGRHVVLTARMSRWAPCWTTSIAPQQVFDVHLLPTDNKRSLSLSKYTHISTYFIFGFETASLRMDEDDMDNRESLRPSSEYEHVDRYSCRNCRMNKIAVADPGVSRVWEHPPFWLGWSF